jgi:hypothetical protein
VEEFAPAASMTRAGDAAVSNVRGIAEVQVIHPRFPTIFSGTVSRRQADL